MSRVMVQVRFRTSTFTDEVLQQLETAIEDYLLTIVSGWYLAPNDGFTAQKVLVLMYPTVPTKLKYDLDVLVTFVNRPSSPNTERVLALLTELIDTHRGQKSYQLKPLYYKVGDPEEVAV
jgi:hypothetical protein